MTINNQYNNQHTAILGIGNALVDALVKIENDSLIEKLSLIRGGMNLVDEGTYLQLDELFKRLSPEYVAGGSAANTIVALSALGINSGFIGCIGDDKIGDIFAKSISYYGVTPYLSVDKGRTGVASTFISDDGERTFATYLGVASSFNKLNVSRDDLKKYSILYIEGYLVNNHELMRQLFDIAKEFNMRIALDIASFNIVEENKEFLDEIIPKFIDILFANEPEAKVLTGKEPKDAIIELSNKVKIAIIKMGKKGSFIGHNNIYTKIEATEVTEVIDTTGAGDLYSAGFLFGLSQDLNLPLCGRLGTLAASKVIQKIGSKLSKEEWKSLKKEMDDIIYS